MPTSRTVVISTQALNRRGFRVITSGIDLAQFKKNPIVLYMHFRPYRGTEDEIRAIGQVENVRVEDSNLKGELKFSQTYAYAKEIEQMWDEGILQMVSAGLTPVEWSDDPAMLLPGQTRYTLSKSKLDEVSVADIGCNDESLAIKNTENGEMVLLKEGANMDFIPLLKTNKEAELITNKENQMDEKILLALGLATGASIEDVVGAITKLKGDLSAVQLRETENLVDNGIKEGRFLADKKGHFIELGKQIGNEALKVTLSAMTPAVKPTQLINRTTPQSGQSVDTSGKKWGELSEKELLQLREESREHYIKLYKEEYGFAPVLK